MYDLLIMDNGVFWPPSCQDLCDQDGKQEINLEWPKILQQAH